MDSTRAAIEEHWSASECGNTEAEHAIYAAEAILDYPQSGERFRGRTTIAAQRGGHPADRHFTVRRITGSGDLWVSECIITYDGVPTYSVSIMEFAHEKVVHETQYFADTFRAPAWRKALAEPMPADTSIPPDPWPGGRPCSVLTRRHSTARGFQVVLADREGASVPAARTELRQCPFDAHPVRAVDAIPDLVDQAITVVVT